jgi:type I restriction enzyme S subunit
MYGATVGKLGVLARAAATNQAVCAIFPPPELDPKFLFWYLRRQRSDLIAKAVGGAQPNISQTILRDLELPIPPLDEQREIVAELEKQFSRLDEAVANLQRVKANLIRYKASVLKAAVEGRLVETEATLARDKQKKFESATELLQRVAQGMRLKTFSAPEQGFAALPEGWAWASVEQLAANDANSIGAGPFGTIFKAKDFRSVGVPIIFLRHVSPLKYLTHKPGFMDVGKWEKLFRPYSVFGGELLITKLGEPPGVCAQYPVGIGPAMVTPDVIKLSVNSQLVSSEYLMYYFNSDPAKRFATGASFGTTRTRLTLPLFREMPVPLPPLAVQARIVAEVDRHLSIIREVEAEIDANLQRSQALRQATLAKAFGTHH